MRAISAARPRRCSKRALYPHSSQSSARSVECTIAEVSERPFLSIVVPAYNEQAVIGRFIDSVRGELPAGIAWEVIVVDDGSVDATVKIVRDAAALDERIRVKGGQIGDFLAETDEADRHLELIADAEHDAALGRAVELGQHDARDLHVLLERLGLGDRVLAGGRVEHHPRLVR